MGEQLKRIWEQMTPAQRVRLGVMLGIVAAGTVALVVWALRPAYAVLYTDLSPTDAAGITEFLREQHIPYRLSHGGTVIEVPEDRVYELRIKTASKGLVGGSTTGFEIFDRSTLPGTDFANRVNLQRALQGELSKTIAALEAVSAARVHIVLPEEDLFGESKPAEASVMVKLRGRLSSEQVRGIQMLVAHSVEGLKPEKVTIVDQYGNVLAGGDGSDVMLTASQMEAKAKYEDRLRRRLQQMMDAFVGPHKSVVQVEADIDFEKQEIKEEQITPVSTGRGLLKREQTVQEDYRGRGTVVGGPAGTASNVTAGGAGVIGGGGGQYTRNEQTREYEYSRKIANILKPPGKITRIAVAVMVDESVDADVQAIKSLVEAAIGAQAARGDVVEVRKVPLEATKIAEKSAKEAEKQAAAQRRARMMSKVGRYLSGLALALVIGGFLLIASRQVRQAVEAESTTRATGEEKDEQLALDEGGEAPAISGEVSGELPEGETSEEEGGEVIGEPGEEAVGEEEELEALLRKYAQEHTGAFAEQLRRLVAGWTPKREEAKKE